VSWSGDGLRVGDGADRRVFLGVLRHRGGGGLAAESEDPPALGLHRVRELKRIETLAQALQLRYLHRIGRPTSRQPLRRGLRCWVTPPQAGAHPLFVGQFHRLAVAVKMVVDELRAVVGINAAQAKR